MRIGNFWSNNYSDRNKILSAEEYLNKIKPYLKDIINDLKKFDMWKIQLTIAAKFISSKDNDEEYAMHSKNNNIEIMINDKPEKVIEELFQSFISSYQIGLETSMRSSHVIFDCDYLLYYKCPKKFLSKVAHK